MDDEINEWDVSEDMTEDDLDYDTSKIPSSIPGSKVEYSSVHTQNTSVQSNPKENPFSMDEYDTDIQESKNQEDVSKMPAQVQRDDNKS